MDLPTDCLSNQGLARVHTKRTPRPRHAGIEELSRQDRRRTSAQHQIHDIELRSLALVYAQRDRALMMGQTTRRKGSHAPCAVREESPKTRGGVLDETNISVP